MLVAIVAGVTVVLWAAWPRPPHSVLLIGIDTLRADALGAYRGTGVHTPRLDHLAREGLVFERALAQAPATGPSFASIHTGTYPVEHDVLHSTRPLPEDRRTMAEHFRERGLRTSAFVSCSIVASRYGFSKGFEHYDEDFESKYSGAHFERDAAATASRAIEWLESLGEDESFFSWVHFFDPHAPCKGRARTDLEEKLGTLQVLAWLGRRRSQKDIDRLLPQIRGLYDAEVTYVDQQVGRILDALRRMERLEDTVVVISADHGEELFDHDFFHGHFTSLTQSVLHVPLIVWHPNTVGRGRVAERVENVDIFPTLAAMLGADQTLEGVSGQDLGPLMRGEGSVKPRVVRAQREPYEKLPGGLGFAALRDRWKLTWYSRVGARLYDLEADPMERRNRASQSPEEVRALLPTIQPWLEDTEKLGFRDPGNLDARDVEVLRELGYIQ
jgi:arylsulfatase A-like enzyme